MAEPVPQRVSENTWYTVFIFACKLTIVKYASKQKKAVAVCSWFCNVYTVCLFAASDGSEEILLC